MTKIKCPCIECVHNGKGHQCTAKDINLTFRSVYILNEGRTDTWVCDKYKLTDWADKFVKEFGELMKGE